MANRFSLNTISKKLLAILMTVAIASTGTVSFVFSAYEIKTSKDEQTENLQSIANMLSPNITAALLFDDTDAIQELINPVLVRPEILSVAVTNMQDQQIAVASQNAKNVIDDSLTQVSTELTFDTQLYGYIHIIADNSSIKERSVFYVQFISLLLVFTFIISLGLSLFLIKKFLNPILYLAQTANKITTSNDYSLRAKQLSQDEVGQLTTCFNDMLETIEQREIVLEKQVRLRTNELENANVQLHQYAYQDGLTDLPNRRYFYEKLQALVNTKNMKFALVFLDLDRFKEINDSLGHDYGDLLLYEVARRLKNCVTENDTIARLGGDEFTLILNDVDNQAAASEIAEKIKYSLSQCITIKKELLYVTTSIGITFFPNDGLTVEELVKRADQAMYLSKSKGRDRYEFFSYLIEEKATETRLLIEEIRTALEQDQFELFYQPIINIDGVTAHKAEALIRWNHPIKGLIYPDEFIPVAEENNLICQIGEWVKKHAVIDTAEFNRLSHNKIQVSVNASALEIDDAGKWVEQWINISKQYMLAHNTILIEVTENTLMETDSPIQTHMKRLNEFGIDIAIDDFGVGYSSLAYLQRLDIDILKIDRSFILDIETNENSIALIKAIITMAHNLNVKVVAEGVESQLQYLLLKQLNCDYIQGYVFSKPISKGEFIKNYITIL